MRTRPGPFGSCGGMVEEGRNNGPETSVQRRLNIQELQVTVCVMLSAGHDIDKP